MKKKNLNMIANFCPPFGGCPAIFENDDDYIVIGKLLSTEESELIKDKIGAGEAAVKISKKLVERKID